MVTFPSEWLALFDAARQGNSGALNDLFQRVRPMLYGQIGERLPARLQARFDLSDVVQSTLGEAYKGFREFEGLTLHEFWGWLTTIQQRNILDLMAAHRRACRNVNRETAVGDAAHVADQDQPDDLASAKEQVDQRLQALARLALDDQQMICLRRVEQLSYAEIAQFLGIQEATARQRFQRAEARWLKEIARANPSQ